jgi:hypothetical protein
MSIALDRPSMLHPVGYREARHEYAIVRREDAASISDVERADAEVVEVTVRWGRTVLGVAHVALDQKLAVGENDRGSIMIPSEVLGAASFTLVDRGRLCMPQGATKIENGLSETREVGKEPTRFELGEAERALTVQVSRVAAARVLPRKSNLKKGLIGIALGSFVAHAAVLTALAFTPGASLDDDTSSLDKSTQATMIQLQQNAADREAKEEEMPTTSTGETSVGGENGGAHQGAPGQIGSLTAKVTTGAYAIKGPPETQEEHLAKTHALIESGQYGALGALSSVLGASKAPVDMYSAFDQEVGKDPVSANGNIAGDHYADSFGYDALGLTGLGPGGGGFTDGIGLGPIGGFGHDPGFGGPGGGNCPAGMKCGLNIGSTLNGGKHDPTGVKMPYMESDVTGGYPKEIVQRIVRANFPRFRQCYEQALKVDPELKGTVSTKFIIDQTGAVETASYAGGTLPDAKVQTCVVSTFYTMGFPAPENGKALVTYPIAFDHE